VICTPDEGCCRWTGSNNAVLVNGCQSLQNLTVTLDVTKDLITLGNTGFSLQLNSYPQPTSFSQGKPLDWFQYLIVIANNSAAWQIQYWSTVSPGYSPTQPWPPGYTPNPPNTTPWLPVLPGDPKFGVFGSAPLNQVPAGSEMKIALATDSNGNVTGATFSITDPSGQVSSYLFPFPSYALYPIYGFQADLVSPPGGSATFKSGAGKLTYSVSPGTLTLQDATTGCGRPQPGTAETSNAVYCDVFEAGLSTLSQPLTHN
jgi:hypothetical protein